MGLDILEVQSCCYFISLRTGTKIVGFITMISNFILGYYTVWLLILMLKHEDLEILGILDLIIQTTQIITSALLLLGAYQEKAKLLVPWIVSTIVSILLEAISSTSVVGQIFGIGRFPIYKWLILTLILLVDDVYGLLVVFSYYRTLTPQRQLNTA